MTQPPIEQYDVGSPKQPADEDAHVDPGGSITTSILEMNRAPYRCTRCSSEHEHALPINNQERRYRSPATASYEAREEGEMPAVRAVGIT